MEQEYGKLFPIFPQDAIVRKKLIKIFASHQPGIMSRAAGSFYSPAKSGAGHF